MSGEAPSDVFSGGVLRTVLSQTHFGLAWHRRDSFSACILAAIFVRLLSAKPSNIGSTPWRCSPRQPSPALSPGPVTPSAAKTSKPSSIRLADILHLVAAAAWVGALVPLVLLLATVEQGRNFAVIARAAVLRFSTLGIVAVGTLLLTGIVNTWYLAGSIEALTGTYYGQLLLAKIALFFAMVAIAAVNRQWLTPRLMRSAGETERATLGAISRLRRNAVIEALAGAAIICIVAVLGTKAPASHANHHPGYGALPADSAFVHIHTEQAMADVMIEPGRVGMAHATVHLWNEDFEPLAARDLKFSVAAPVAGSAPTTHTAVQDSDGAWQIDGLGLTQPGNWMVTVDADLDSGSRVVLAAPIVIDPAP